MFTSQCKNGLIRRVASLEGDYFIVFYNLNVSEIWPDKRCGLWWEGLYERGTTVIKDEVLIMVGCPIFPSILIAKYLFTGN
jgi:hypothetical protein